MLRSDKRAARPRVESLESHCLLSGGLAHPAAVVHQLNVVDLKATSVGAELARELAAASPTTTTLDSLSASQKGRGVAKIQGQISVLDPEGPKGPVTVIIKFTSPLEHAKAGKVQINAGKFAKLVTSAQKAQLKAGLVSFVSQEHDQIASLLKSS